MAISQNKPSGAVRKYSYNNFNGFLNWRPPSLSELTPMKFNTGLTHLGSETSNYIIQKFIALIVTFILF